MAIQATGQTALATTKPREMTQQEQRFASLRSLLGNNMKAITAALPSHMKPERLARIALTTVQKNPKLMECTQESFLSCILSCAALGLEPDGLLGQAYLIPFWDSRERKLICTLIPGYKGLIKLARQSGEVSTIDAHEVRIGDDFNYRYGSEPFLRHVPAECPIIEAPKTEGTEAVRMPDPSWRPGEITHFYAITKLRDGTVQFVVMPRWEVNEIRDGSQNYQSAKEKGYRSPWDEDQDYPEMGKKTAIRRLSKMIPASVEKDNLLQKAVAIDERADRGLGQNLDEVHMLDIELPPEAATATAPPAQEGVRTKLGGESPSPATTAPEAKDDSGKKSDAPEPGSSG